MITIRCPEYAKAEHDYICHVIFGVFLGLDYRIEHTGSDGVSITLPNNAVIDCHGTILKTLDQDWLGEHTLAQLSANYISINDLPVPVRANAEQCPVLSIGDAHNTIEQDSTHITIKADLLGSAFLMLSRYEEALENVQQDRHGRFPATESIAEKHDFLHIPVVNIYLEILWGCMAALCPSLERKKHSFSIMPTHDVDAPYESMFLGFSQAARQSASLALKQRAPIKGVNTMIAWMTYQTGRPVLDSYDTFSFLMDVSEKAGTQSHFYFKTGKTDSKCDVYYDPAAPAVKSLMRAIHKRGHMIGFHPSYHTAAQKKDFDEEYKTLRTICDELDITQDEWGGRQHYLKWNARTSPAMWEGTGMAYDTTLSFADKPGFRCGTCYEFPLYDLETRKRLSVYERPLIVMEQSVLSYMKLAGNLDEAWNVFASLKAVCKFYEGQYVLLWHNSQLPTRKLRDFYRSLISSS